MRGADKKKKQNTDKATPHTRATFRLEWELQCLLHKTRTHKPLIEFIFIEKISLRRAKHLVHYKILRANTGRCVFLCGELKIKLTNSACKNKTWFRIWCPWLIFLIQGQLMKLYLIWSQRIMERDRHLNSPNDLNQILGCKLVRKSNSVIINYRFTVTHCVRNFRLLVMASWVVCWDSTEKETKHLENRIWIQCYDLNVKN